MNDEKNLSLFDPKSLALVKTEEDLDKWLVGLSDELNRRLEVQARNLTLEYRLTKAKTVPVEHVEALMRLYGKLIAKLIFEDQQKARR